VPVGGIKEIELKVLRCPMLHARAVYDHAELSQTAVQARTSDFERYVDQTVRKGR